MKKSIMEIDTRTGYRFTREEANRAIKDARATAEKFEAAVKWLAIYDRELRRNHLKANFEKLLGFDPKRELVAEQKRLEQAEQTRRKWLAGTMKNPSASYIMTGRSLTCQIRALDQWTAAINAVNERIEDSLTGDRKYRAELAYADANQKWLNTTNATNATECAGLLGA